MSVLFAAVTQNSSIFYTGKEPYYDWARKRCCPCHGNDEHHFEFECNDVITKDGVKVAITCVIKYVSFIYANCCGDPYIDMGEQIGIVKHLKKILRITLQDSTLIELLRLKDSIGFGVFYDCVAWLKEKHIELKSFEIGTIRYEKSVSEDLIKPEIIKETHSEIIMDDFYFMKENGTSNISPPTDDEQEKSFEVFDSQNDKLDEQGETPHEQYETPHEQHETPQGQRYKPYRRIITIKSRRKTDDVDEQKETFVDCYTKTQVLETSITVLDTEGESDN